MSPLKESRQCLQEFESLAEEVDLSSSDLEKFTQQMSRPNCDSLRLFLAVGAKESPTAQWMADTLYINNRGGHNCYRNDQFCIAHLFDFNEQKKHESALSLIENGMAGYFEVTTHGGFYLPSILNRLGALEYAISVQPSKRQEYFTLSERRIRKIAERFSVNEEELALCAKNVCKWALNKAYGVKAEHTFCADTALPLESVECLANTFLKNDSLKEMFALIEEGKIPKDRVTCKNYRPPWSVIKKAEL